jgi:carboxypeptidase Q
MKKALPAFALVFCLALAAALFPVGASSSLPAAAPGELKLAPTQTEISAIVASALGPSPLEENLRKLTDEIGGRMSGTPAMRRAVQWAQEAFREAGVDRVWTESFAMPEGWREGATRLEILAPVTFTPGVVSLGWSPPTPEKGLEAWVVNIGEGSEEEFVRAGVLAKDALLLASSPVLASLEDLFNEYLRAPAIIDRAVAAGAAGILWTSTREHGLLYRHVNNLRGQVDRLPQALVAREDALRIGRLLAAGKQVRARLEMPNRAEGMVVEENVVAEIRGREKPEEVVILGAHLDSWDLGDGALDNGCNSALVVDVARALRAAGRAPRRTVRFVLFSGEEQGLIG